LEFHLAWLANYLWLVYPAEWGDIMSKCPACNDKGYITIQDIIAGLAVEYDAPCPLCTDIIKILESKRDAATKKFKTTVIPDAECYFPDEDDSRLAQTCGKEVEDEITTTTIEEFLK